MKIIKSLKAAFLAAAVAISGGAYSTDAAAYDYGRGYNNHHGYSHHHNRHRDYQPRYRDDYQHRPHRRHDRGGIDGGDVAIALGATVLGAVILNQVFNPPAAVYQAPPVYQPQPQYRCQITGYDYYRRPVQQCGWFY